MFHSDDCVEIANHNGKVAKQEVEGNTNNSEKIWKFFCVCTVVYYFSTKVK